MPSYVDTSAITTADADLRHGQRSLAESNLDLSTVRVTVLYIVGFAKRLHDRYLVVCPNVSMSHIIFAANQINIARPYVRPMRH